MGLDMGLDETEEGDQDGTESRLRASGSGTTVAWRLCDSSRGPGRPVLLYHSRHQDSAADVKHPGDSSKTRNKTVTLPKTNVDPDVLAPWKSVFLYQPVVFQGPC